MVRRPNPKHPQPVATVASEHCIVNFLFYPGKAKPSESRRDKTNLLRRHYSIQRGGSSELVVVHFWGFDIVEKFSFHCGGFPDAVDILEIPKRCPLP